MCYSAKGELVPYTEVVNGLLVQQLNWSSNVGEKEPGQQTPFRYSLSFSWVASAVAEQSIALLWTHVVNITGKQSSDSLAVEPAEHATILVSNW